MYFSELAGQNNNRFTVELNKHVGIAPADALAVFPDGPAMLAFVSGIR
jgi:hypothetical protein